MGKKIDKAINAGWTFIGNYCWNILVFVLLGSILSTRLDFKNKDEADWPINPSFYNLSGVNKYKMAGGGKKRNQKGGNSVGIPYSLDNLENNNIIQYLGNYFKEDWFNFRNIMKSWVSWDLLNHLVLDPSDTIENRDMWLLWKSITYKNIAKTTGLILYFLILLPIISVLVALGTSWWAIFTNPYLVKYKQENAVYMYWLLMFFGVFFGMYVMGSSIWSVSVILQILFFLFYIVLSPLKNYKRVGEHMKNLFNFRKSADEESKSHGFLKFLMFTLLVFIIGLSGEKINWWQYNIPLMTSFVIAEIFMLFLYYKYH